jgi:hypothetical protein
MRKETRRIGGERFARQEDEIEFEQGGGGGEFGFADGAA